MESVDEILERALQLSSKDRGKIVEILIRSLDPPGDDLSEEEWAKVWGPELERRALACERGEMEVVDWRESLARVRESLHEKNPL
jgi:hypothetical protein